MKNQNKDIQSVEYLSTKDTKVRTKYRKGITGQELIVYFLGNQGINELVLSI
jgi:hypothetical protein